MDYIVMKKSKPKEMLPAIQGLRVLAFLSIFISHTNIIPVGMQVALGAWGVSVFLVISGFVMVYSYFDRGGVSGSPNISFSYKKIKRLYPLHLITLFGYVVIEIVKIMKGRGSVVNLARDIFLHTTLTQVWIPIPSIYKSLNLVDWYLAVLAFLYFLFPYLLQVVRELTKKSCAVLLLSLFFLQIGVSVIAYFFGNKDIASPFSMQWITYFCPLSRLLDFFVGCCLGWLFLHKSMNASSKVIFSFFEVIVLIGILFSFTLCANKVEFWGDEYIRYTLLFTITSMATVWLCAECKGIVSKLISQKIFVSFAKVTPYAFLIHYVVLAYCRKIVGMFTNSKYAVVVVAFVLTIIAYFTWIWISECIRRNRQANL